MCYPLMSTSKYKIFLKSMKSKMVLSIQYSLPVLKKFPKKIIDNEVFITR